jgi:hypothetical protein
MPNKRKKKINIQICIILKSRNQKSIARQAPLTQFPSPVHSYYYLCVLDRGSSKVFVFHICDVAEMVVIHNTILAKFRDKQDNIKVKKG